MTVFWNPAINIVGDMLRLERDGEPIASLDLDASSFSGLLTAPGEYTFSLSLDGADDAQCPGLPLECIAVWIEDLDDLEDGIAFVDSFEQYTTTRGVEACGWELRREPANNMPPADGTNWLLAPTLESCRDLGAGLPDERGFLGRTVPYLRQRLRRSVGDRRHDAVVRPRQPDLQHVGAR